ncbi:HD domain-containing phosphohydrolase [Desulfobotulus mexicanus]|uniref:HD domain-containing protein n=1 Tax=Desulfobotulus mexicanus TaxID=2586642 RepID=A0A5S5MD47_9BACT|nr:HD domain-containing phosphohydrolase [Desulfobotulus mexicanus]TYT73642.1 HD domain-containing protein [Desulfobotulus mexicanus]
MRQNFPETAADISLSFEPEKTASVSYPHPLPPWEVLIADDDPEVHRVTRLVLRDFHFDNRSLLLHSVYSGSETIRFLRHHPDIAVLLLDAVMENDEAGLIAANRIRKELKNQNIRIIFRTGQAGKAPESLVVDQYDINDYREKAELSAQKLRSAITTSLRNFRELQSAHREKDALRHILSTTSPVITDPYNPSFFACTVRDQVQRLLLAQPFQSRKLTVSFSVKDKAGQLLCTTHRTKDKLTTPSASSFSPNLLLWTESMGKRSLELSVCALPELSMEEKTMLDIFIGHIADVLDKMLDHQPDILMETRFSRLLTHALSNSPRKESAGHLHRVGAFCHYLALKAGLEQKTAEELKRAAPLHDIGKLAIPQAILNKRGPLNAEEQAIIRTHPDIGFELLHDESRPDLQTAAIVAREHHERWDGAGYPLGIAGEKINILGRITAIGDVFDALTHDRSYKKAWPLPKALEFLKKKAGSIFDPRLVSCFIQDTDSLARIHAQWPDT